MSIKNSLTAWRKCSAADYLFSEPHNVRWTRTRLSLSNPEETEGAVTGLCACAQYSLRPCCAEAVSEHGCAAVRFALVWKCPWAAELVTTWPLLGKLHRWWKAGCCREICGCLCAVALSVLMLQSILESGKGVKLPCGPYDLQQFLQPELLCNCMFPLLYSEIVGFKSRRKQSAWESHLKLAQAPLRAVGDVWWWDP